MTARFTFRVQRSGPAGLLGVLWLYATLSAQATSPEPSTNDVLDIRQVPPDLVIPPLQDQQPSAGRRVRQTHPDYGTTKIYHVLYLPTDWKPNGQYPVIVEFAGNGPFRNRFGDVSTGRVEGSKLGYGISGGRSYIWLCLPFINQGRTANVTRWWGDPPQYNPQPTVDYAKLIVPWVCRRYGGDPQRVLLTGFSRGAIACNYIGLYDEQISRLWRAFVPYSHYDGVNENWGYPGADRKAARRRLERLRGRAQFICHETTSGALSLSATKRYVSESGVEARFEFVETGFRNHNDAWVLRPSSARRKLRTWVEMTMK